MKNKNDWLNDITKQINLLHDTLSVKDYKKYKLRLVLCLVERITQFYDECGQCQTFHKELSDLLQEVSNLAHLPDKQRQKSYLKSVDKVSNHLQKQHKLVKEGYYTGLGISIGSGLGVALGAAMPRVGAGIPVGIGIGLAIGAALDAKAKKEGRILCPKEASATAPAIRSKTIMVVIGLLVLAGLAAFFFVRR